MILLALLLLLLQFLCDNSCCCCCCWYSCNKLEIWWKLHFWLNRARMLQHTSMVLNFDVKEAIRRNRAAQPRIRTLCDSDFCSFVWKATHKWKAHSCKTVFANQCPGNTNVWEFLWVSWGPVVSLHLKSLQNPCKILRITWGDVVMGENVAGEVSLLFLLLRTTLNTTKWGNGPDGDVGGWGRAHPAHPPPLHHLQQPQPQLQHQPLPLPQKPQQHQTPVSVCQGKWTLQENRRGWEY